MNSKKLFLNFLLVSILSISTIVAQSDDSEKISASLSLNHDAFFGFNPMMAISYDVSDKGSLTFYGIQWGAGTGSAWGQWTEFGFGYNIEAGDFNINPQLGFTMGNLLSSGVSGRPVVGDGIVPNLTVNYGTDKFEGQIYAGYYGALRNETVTGQSTLNYVHYWANFGYKASSFLSLGAHFEELYLASGKGNGIADINETDGYMWFGPYLQLSKGNAGLRFSFGADVLDNSALSDFYKLSFFISL